MAVPHVQSIINGVQRARSRFLYGLDVVPDDRLTWTPGGSAKSALELGARAGGFLQAISAMFRGEEFQRGAGAPPAISSRDEAKGIAAAGFDAMVSTLESLTDADMERIVQTPFGPNRVIDMLPFVTAVVGYFQGQLNYLQLCYGDEDANIPPDWKHE